MHRRGQPVPVMATDVSMLVHWNMLAVWTVTAALIYPAAHSIEQQRRC